MRCIWCHKDVEGGWSLCPDCGAQLEPDLDSGTALPSYRPAGEPCFEPFVIASVRRVTPSGPLVVLGVNERVEANLVPGTQSVVCRDITGTVLFRLERYEPAAGGVVSFTEDGEPIATYLPDGPRHLEVRDGASAPVATLVTEHGSDDNWDLMERGGRRRLAACWRQDYSIGDWVDEQWFVMPTAEGRIPVPTLGLVGLPIVCHAWLGRAAHAVQDSAHTDDASLAGWLMGTN